jgi:hypothetical protein
VTSAEYRRARERIEDEKTQLVARAQEAFGRELKKVSTAAGFQQQKAQREFAARESAIRKEAATAATAALAKKLAESEAQVQATRASVEETVTQRLSAQRETLSKRSDEALAAERVKHFEERTRLTQQLAELQRRLEEKSVNSRSIVTA